MKEKTCCFSGHRKLPNDRINEIKNLLNKEIDTLINKGITDFISGGAIGFDLIAAHSIIEKKQKYRQLRLIFVLPCMQHDKYWTESDKRLFQFLITKGDKIIYISEEYSSNCIKLRNQYMVNQSAYCICALIYRQSGTGQTVNFAHKKGLNVINVAE